MDPAVQGALRHRHIASVPSAEENQGVNFIAKDAPRGGRSASGRAALAAEILRKTTTEIPPGETHWSTRNLALCVDERSPIQALDRTQPLLPMQPRQTERRTPDYARHGATSLFTALNVATGEVIIGHCLRRHRHQEFLKFLNEIAAPVCPINPG